MRVLTWYLLLHGTNQFAKHITRYLEYKVLSVPSALSFIVIHLKCKCPISGVAKYPRTMWHCCVFIARRLIHYYFQGSRHQALVQPFYQILNKQNKNQLHPVSRILQGRQREPSKTPCSPSSTEFSRHCVVSGVRLLPWFRSEEMKILRNNNSFPRVEIEPIQSRHNHTYVLLHHNGLLLDFRLPFKIK